MSKTMTPNRPYLVRAFYEWLLDNELTPHLVVDADKPGVRVPRQFVEDGQIVLNIAPQAVGNLQIANESISFNARFGGQPELLYIPLAAVAAIYARENGAGTVFQPDPAYDEAEPVETTESQAARPKGRPSLKVVK